MKLRNIIISAVLAAGCILTAGCGNSANSSDSTAAPNAVGSPNESGSSSAIGTSGEGNINMQLNKGDTIAEITIEGYGTVKAKLFPEIAPKGVDNFIKLANNGYYEGKTIHRVMADFMLQGGSLNGDGTGGEAADGGSFGIEPNYNARHFYGALCYANAAGQNTTQFYIVNNKQEQNLSDISTDTVMMYIAQYEMYRDMYEDGTMEYSYYNSLVVNYENLLDMISNATDEVKEQYKSGGTPSLDGGYTVFGQVYEGFDVIDAVSACNVVENSGGELSKPVDTIKITSVKISKYAG